MEEASRAGGLREATGPRPGVQGMRVSAFETRTLCLPTHTPCLWGQETPRKARLSLRNPHCSWGPTEAREESRVRRWGDHPSTLDLGRAASWRRLGCQGPRWE